VSAGLQCISIPTTDTFTVAGLDAPRFQDFLGRCQGRGVYLKWFGNREAKGYTSLSEQWHYMHDPHTPPQTFMTLERLCDMRIPLGLGVQDCATIAEIIAEELSAADAARDIVPSETGD